MWISITYYLLLPICLSSVVTPYLKIVVLDMNNDINKHGMIQSEYNITSRTSDVYAVVQWKKLTTTTDNIHNLKPILNTTKDELLLITTPLCESNFLPETALSSFSCLAPVSSTAPLAAISSSKRKRRRRAVQDPSLLCVYHYDKYKKIRAVIAIVQSLKWHNVILFYNNDSEFEVMTITDRMHKNVTLKLYNIDGFENTPEKLHKLLHEIYTQSDYSDIHIILMCSQNCINTTIRQANNFDRENKGATAIGFFSKWLLIDFHSRTYFQDGCDLKIDNIAVVNFPFTNVNIPILKNNLLVSLQNTVKNTIDGFTEVDPPELNKIIEEALLNELTNATDCWRVEIFTLLYKPKGRVLSPVGYVTCAMDVQLFPDVIIFPNTKFGFNKRVFLTTTNDWQPFTKRLPKVNGTVQFEGYSIDYLDVIAASLNFSYTLTEPEDGDWGVIKNNSWTGVVGQLSRREVDLFAGPLAISSEREEVIDFTFPYFHVYTVVIFRRPDPNKTKWRKLIDPFSWQVHVCILASFLGIILMLYTIERLNPFYNASFDERPTFQGLVLYLFGALLTQGGSSMPSSIAGRSLLATWWIFCLITVATYSGNLIAFLTVTKENLPFATLEELGNQNDYKWGTLGGSIWVSLLKESNLSTFKNLWHGLQKFNETEQTVFSFSQDVHMKKVIEEDYGFIADKTTAENWIFENCELTYLKELFFPMHYAFALPNNSPYLQHFSNEVMKILESGLGQTLKRKWWPRQNICLEPVTQAKKIYLVDLQSAFYVVGIGIGIASIIIFIETCFKREDSGYILKYKMFRALIKRKNKTIENNTKINHTNEMHYL